MQPSVTGADSPLTVHGESLPWKRTVQSVHRVSPEAKPSAVSMATDPEGDGAAAAMVVTNRKATPNRSFGNIQLVYIRSSCRPLTAKSPTSYQFVINSSSVGPELSHYEIKEVPRDCGVSAQALAPSTGPAYEKTRTRPWRTPRSAARPPARSRYYQKSDCERGGKEDTDGISAQAVEGERDGDED